MVQAATAELSSVTVQASNVLIRVRRPQIEYCAFQSAVNTVPVLVLPKVHEFSLKVASIPKEGRDAIEVYTGQSYSPRPREATSWLAIGDTEMAGLSLPWRWLEMITKTLAICSRIRSPLRQIILPLPMNDTL